VQAHELNLPYAEKRSAAPGIDKSQPNKSKKPVARRHPATFLTAFLSRLNFAPAGNPVKAAASGPRFTTPIPTWRQPEG
jgi:hypothetical protein